MVNSSHISVLEFCPNDSMDRCYTSLGWKYLIVGINIFSVLTNIFHLVVIGRMRSLRGSSYLIALQQISIADIYSSVATFPLLCPVNQLYLGKDIRLASLVATFQGNPAHLRFAVLALGCYERLLTIRAPETQQTEPRCGSSLDKLQKVKLLNICLWIMSFLFPFSRNYFYRESLCLYALFGPSINGAPKSSLIILSFMVSFTVIIAVCSGKLVHKLRVCSVTDNLSTKRATKYVIIINMAYYVCIIPAYSLFILTSFGVDIAPARWSVHLLYSLYGIFNVIVYGWMSKPYRKVVMKMLTCWNKKGPSSDENETAISASDVNRRLSIRYSNGEQAGVKVTQAESSVFTVTFAKPLQIAATE